MATKIRIPIGSTNEVKSNPFIKKNNVIVFAGGVDGSVTAGVLTVLCRAPDSTVFETPKDSSGDPLNTIDFSAPEKLNIYGPIEQFDFTIAGGAGGATILEISVDSFD
jgi:hypothetical protein